MECATSAAPTEPAVDGERITERQLRDGSVLALGDVQVRVTRRQPVAPRRRRPAGIERADHHRPAGARLLAATQRWAPAESAALGVATFDREAALPMAQDRPRAAKVEVERPAAAGFAKLAVLVASSVLGAIVFFDLSSARCRRRSPGSSPSPTW
jgi:hypothetical protein